jgi:cytokinin dehydrogenase
VDRLEPLLRERVAGAVHAADRIPAELATNFGRIFRATPRFVVEPRGAEDVAATLRFAREQGLAVSTRGSGHSQSHVAISDGGILLDMRSMGRVLSVDDEGRTADVEGGAVWREVVRQLMRRSLVPRVLTNNLSVTVGGTLSMAGVGVASFKYGTQGDNVLELDVVTGRGDLVTCGPNRAPDLFWSVLAGLGQVGVITRARLVLRPAKAMTRTYYLLYEDLDRFLDDARGAMARPEWDHLESWASPCPQGTKPVSGRREVFARWFFPFHPTVEFERGAPPDDEALLRGLRPYERLYVDDLPTLDFLERLDPIFDLWKRGGTWEHVHAWMETVLPWATAADFVRAVLADLPPSILVGGHVILWPAKGNTSRSRLFMRPEGEDLLGFGILPAIPPRFWEEARPMIENAGRMSVLMGGKRYLSGYVPFDDGDWRRHFGDQWEFFRRAKATYDPDGILNPGFVPLAGGAARA